MEGILLFLISYTLMILSFFATGLKINLNKSVIIPLGRVDNVEVLAAELGCGVESLPSTYLGLLTGLWGFGIPSKKDLDEDCQPGNDCIF